MFGQPQNEGKVTFCFPQSSPEKATARHSKHRKPLLVSLSCFVVVLSVYRSSREDERCIPVWQTSWGCKNGVWHLPLQFHRRKNTGDHIDCSVAFLTQWCKLSHSGCVSALTVTHLSLFICLPLHQHSLAK